MLNKYKPRYHGDTCRVMIRAIMG